MGIYDDYQYFHNNLFPQQFGQHVTLLPSTCITNLIPTAKGLIWLPDKIN